MKDAIGQEISVGDDIVHSDINESVQRVHTVHSINVKTVQVWHMWSNDSTTITHYRPDTVVVITSNLKALNDA